MGASIHGLLKRILDEPEGEHEVAKHLPRGGLLVGHVIELYRLMSTARGGPWSKLFSTSRVDGRGWSRGCAGSRKLLPPVHVDSEGARAATSYLTKEATERGQLRRENSRNPSHPTRPLVPSPLVTAPAALQSSPLTLTQVLGRREAGPTVRSSIPPALIPLPPRSYPLRPALLTPHLPPH